MVSIGKAILLTLGALTLLAAIVVGGYLGGWWLQNNSAQRQTHLIQHGDSAQTSYADAVENNLITIHSLDAQKLYMTVFGDDGDELKLYRFLER